MQLSISISDNQIESCFFFQALREAVRRSRSDEAPATVLDTYMFLIEKVIMRNESRLQDALATCDEALSLLPTYAKLYSAKGVILLKMNRTSEALPLLMVRPGYPVRVLLPYSVSCVLPSSPLLY